MLMKIFYTTLIIFTLLINSFGNICDNTYKDIANKVQEMGFTVTSTIEGRHNIGSKHYQGKAVDVRTRDKTETEICQLKSTLEEMGYVVLDERTRPMRGVWSGPHLHVHVADCVGTTKPKTELFTTPKIKVFETELE